MYYIYNDRVAIKSEPGRPAVFTYLKPNEADATFLMYLARRNMSSIIQRPSASPTEIKKTRDPIDKEVLRMQAGYSPTQAELESMPITTIAAVFGQNHKQHKVDEKKYKDFVDAVDTYNTKQRLRQTQFSSMSKEDVVTFILTFPMNREKLDALMHSIAKLWGKSLTSSGDYAVDTFDDQFLFSAFSILKGFEESGDPSTIDKLIELTDS